MKRIEKGIIHFLENRDNCNSNPHNVDILIEDGCMYTTSWWIQKMKLRISIGANLVHESVYDFLIDFNIREIKDLGKIKHAHSMELYAIGKACLFFYVSVNCLFYKKKNDRMVMIDDTTEHELPGILSGPGEFTAIHVITLPPLIPRLGRSGYNRE
jgi:hypothetical protein